MAKRLTKTTKKQYEKLLDFVEKNIALLTRKTKPFEAHKLKILWQKFSEDINTLGIGPEKTADQWKKIYAEWKINVRRKSRQIEYEKRQPGSNEQNMKRLNETEEKLLSLISKSQGDDGLLGSSITASQSQDSNFETATDVQSTLLIQNKKCATAEHNELSNIGGIVVKQEFNDTDTNDSLSEPEKATQEVLNVFTDDNTSPETKPANIYTNRAEGYEGPGSPFLTESAGPSCNDAQNFQYLAAMENAAALKALGDAIKSVANALTGATEIRKIEAEAKLMTAQASLVKARALQTSVRIKLMEYLRNKDNK